LCQPELKNDPRFISNPQRVENRPAVNGIVGAELQKLTTEQIIARLEDAQIAYARLNSVQEFVDHPQLAARGRWRDVDSPVGPLRALVPPVTMEGVEPVMGAIPALGEHTDSILQELGFDSATIATWRKTKII
jgi:itaconate CoA-transferase